MTRWKRSGPGPAPHPRNGCRDRSMSARRPHPGPSARVRADRRRSRGTRGRPGRAALVAQETARRDTVQAQDRLTVAFLADGCAYWSGHRGYQRVGVAGSGGGVRHDTAGGGGLGAAIGGGEAAGMKGGAARCELCAAPRTGCGSLPRPCTAERRARCRLAGIEPLTLSAPGCLHPGINRPRVGSSAGST